MCGMWNMGASQGPIDKSYEAIYNSLLHAALSKTQSE